MRRRLLDLCLLAYPRTRRADDGDYLRDLALELAETDGLARQALSLLRGGLGERIGRRRLRLVAIVGLALATTALAAGTDARAEDDRLACVQAACPEMERLVAERVRAGWDCETRRRTQDGGRAIAWRCTL